MFDVEQQKKFLWKVSTSNIEERNFSPQQKFNYIFGLRVFDFKGAKKKKKGSRYKVYL